MKNRADQSLLVVCVLSLALYALAIPRYLEGIPLDWPEWAFTACAWLAVSFHAVPVFCLQLLLCRKTPRWIAAIPALAIVGAVLWFACGFFTATGWDTLGWGILLILSIAPAAGCFLAWAVYGLWQLYRKGDIRHA